MKHISAYLIAALILVIVAVCITPGSASSGYFWSKNGYLYQGQAATYEIQVDCGAQLVLKGPYGADFDIYAMRSPVGSWPNENYIMAHYDKSELSYSQEKYLNLDQGSWYVVVYSSSGYGQFNLDASSTCSGPVPPRPDPCYGDPNCGGTNCVPAATDVKTGYLNSGEAKTYTYQIMGDRNYIEWILSGPCGDEVIPMAMMSSNDVSTMRTSYCGPDFSLYIYKDCDPRYRNCAANKADTSSGSNKYVGITYPTTGSRYYALVYAKNGSGAYTLYARSYKCQNDVIAMMTKPDMVTMMSTASDIEAPVSVLGST
ncbi:MAG: hypothetical protein LUQ50_13720 [Methanospirillum sp.]|uniref:hypothetical protein n=1 Tax=Methanospirillum sp. TaxID=45200 RepID=UPI00236D27E3|nr:hypothetical protein [Methanospirillum sp.]MDD1730114.1 hypothetical protein [Methanospirillum sp.]